MRLEILREEKPLGQVAAEHEVHPSQLRKWKQMAGEHLPSSLSENRGNDGHKCEWLG